jgi:uncharacterized protein
MMMELLISTRTKLLKRFATPIGALLTLTLVACTPSTPPAQQLLDSVGQRVILPFHQQFEASATKLQQSSDAFCRQPDATQWSNVQAHWLSAMTDWQAVRLIQFGPIITDNQHWKIQFWPDKHNLIRKKINALLNSSDDITVERIEKASVVVQGLSALEFLLFDQDGGQRSLYSKPKGDTRRCQLLMAVSAHTQQVAAHLNAEWQPTGSHYLATLIQPGEKNTEYPNHEAALAALVDTLVASLESAKRDQLATPMGYRDKAGKPVKRKPRPYLAQAWRSRQSIVLLQANIQAARQLFNGGISASEKNYGFKHYLNHQISTQALAGKIDNQFTRIINQLDAMEPSLFDAVANQPTPQIHQVYEDVAQLVKLVKNQLPPAMGVTLGFNANDGD